MKTVKNEALFEELRRAIVTKKYAPGEKLPAEKEFAVQLGVARNTLRRALARLESAGLIRRYRLHGTIVADPLPEKTQIIVLNSLPYYHVSNPTLYLLPGIQHACEKKDFAMTILQLPYFLSADPAVFENVRGFLCFGGRFTGNEPFLLRLKQIGKPVIIVDGYMGEYERTGFRTIHPDRKAEWNRATLALQNAGAKRIGFLLANNSVRGYDEIGKWKTFLKQHGLWAPELIRSVNESADGVSSGIKEALEKFLSLSAPPDVVLCHSDFIALELLRTAAEAGVAVPEKFGVMGFGGYPGGAYLTPGLSTVDYHYCAMGEKAVDMLLDEKNTVKEMILECELVWRGSTANLTMKAE